MALVTGQVTLPSSAGPAVPVVQVGVTGSVVLTNTGADLVYYGGPGVTVTNGAPISAGQSVSIPSVANARVYAIGTAGGEVLGFAYGTELT